MIKRNENFVYSLTFATIIILYYSFQLRNKSQLRVIIEAGLPASFFARIWASADVSTSPIIGDGMTTDVFETDISNIRLRNTRPSLSTFSNLPASTVQLKVMRPCYLYSLSYILLTLTFCFLYTPLRFLLNKQTESSLERVNRICRCSGNLNILHYLFSKLPCCTSSFNVFSYTKNKNNNYYPAYQFVRPPFPTMYSVC